MPHGTAWRHAPDPLQTSFNIVFENAHVAVSDGVRYRAFTPAAIAVLRAAAASWRTTI